MLNQHLFHDLQGKYNRKDTTSTSKDSRGGASRICFRFIKKSINNRNIKMNRY